MAPELAAAAVGGISSLIGSGINAYSAYKDRKEARKRRKEALEQLSGWESEANKILEEAQNSGITLTSPQDAASYQKMREGYNPNKYVFTDYQPFDKDSYHVEDYLDPYKDTIMKELARSVTHTAAGAGLGHSSGAIEAYNKAAVEKYGELYDKAFNRMNTERNFDYGAYTDYINQKQKELDTLQQGTLNQMNFLRGDLLFDQQQRDAMTGNRLNLGNTLAQTRASLV